MKKKERRALKERVYKQELVRLEGEMQAQADYHAKLREYVNVHGSDSLPMEHKKNVKAAFSTTPWEKDPVVCAKIEKTAKIATKNVLKRGIIQWA